MEDGGSSTESEYYDLSDEEEPKFSIARDGAGADGQNHAAPGENAAETSRRRPAPPANGEDNHDMYSGMATQWNNVLTPHLAAVVARVAAHSARRARAEPLAIPLDPPVDALPRSSEFVSPFGALALPKAVPVVKKEKSEPQEARVEKEPAPAAPARVVIDLSLDSDDDDDDEEHDETVAERVAAAIVPPRAQPLEENPRSESQAPLARTQRRDEPVAAVPPSRVISTGHVPRSRSDRDTTSTQWTPAPLSAPRPPARAPEPHRTSANHHRAPRQECRHQSETRSVSRPPPSRDSSRTVTASASRVAPEAAPVPQLRPPQLTLSCNRCHRLVPSYSVSPANARYDCKCCERKYIQEELAVRGANRRCMFCNQLPQPLPAPASAPNAQPLTPRTEAAVFGASISPAADVISSPLGVQPTKILNSRPKRPLTQVTRAPRPVITCVTCHQHLKPSKPVTSAAQYLDPWFCTCCQRLLCSSESPPDDSPGSRQLGVPRCMSCAIAACDLYARVAARRPNLDLLKTLNRFAKTLQALMKKHVGASGKPVDVESIQRDSIKLEIDQRLRSSRKFRQRVFMQQQRVLATGDISQTSHQKLFGEQLALEQDEADILSRLVAYLAVELDSRKVPLPAELRGIVTVDEPSATPKEKSRTPRGEPVGHPQRPAPSKPSSRRTTGGTRGLSTPTSTASPAGLLRVYKPRSFDALDPNCPIPASPEPPAKRSRYLSYEHKS